jgi:hypothetical protein
MMRADAQLEALWKRVLDDWDSDASHALFLEHCQRTEQLAEAAARYLGMTGDRVRGPSAQKRLQAVATLAVLALEASRTSPRVVTRNASHWALIVLFVAATLGILIYASLR